MEKDDLLDRFSAEFVKLETEPNITVSLSPTDMWILLGQIQLALRHPDNRGMTAKRAKEIALMFQERMASEGALKEVAEKGWIKEYDM